MSATAKTHTVVSEIGTCQGELGKCSDAGPKHKPHPQHFCSCGAWYLTERGRKSHIGREASWMPVADALKLVKAAGFTHEPCNCDSGFE